MSPGKTKESILDIDDPRWLKLIQTQPGAVIFHHPAWIGLLSECYRYPAYILALEDQDGNLCGGIPLIGVKSFLTGRRLVSLPFCDFCPPLAADEAGLEPLLKEVQKQAERSSFPMVEIRWPLPEQPGVYCGDEYAVHTTLLEPDPAALFGRFKKTRVRQTIRQAQEAGVTIRRGDDWQDVLRFFHLHLNTRRRLGTPVQPIRFFSLLWTRLLSQGLGFLLLAYHQDVLIAGAIFLHWQNKLTYKFSASNPEFWSLKPNNLILWEAIRWGCEQGFQVFDWGRTDLEDQGLRDFKSGWDSQESLIHYSILSSRPVPRSTGKVKALFASIIQHSPLWVCRMAGELFYGHFA